MACYIVTGYNSACYLVPVCEMCSVCSYCIVYHCCKPGTARLSYNTISSSAYFWQIQVSPWFV